MHSAPWRVITNDHLPLRNPRPSHDRLAATYSMVHVMSEVHRYQVVQMFTEDGNKISYSPTGPWVVMASMFDLTKADLDAQRLRADTAEAELSLTEKEVEGLQSALGDAEQRIAELKGALENLLDAYSKPDDRICCSGAGCGCMGTTVQQQAEYYAKEALNPNPEAESHE